VFFDFNVCLSITSSITEGEIQKSCTFFLKNDISKFNLFFADNGKPIWTLELSAKFLATADSLRYRGQGVRNNLGNSFFLCAQCNQCKSVYNYPSHFCSVINCKDSTLDTKALFYHPIQNHMLSKKNSIEFGIYERFNHGYDKVSHEITNKNNIRFLVRENYQMFTCGDILLSQVSIIDRDFF
jgi:hypothetical protein